MSLVEGTPMNDNDLDALLAPPPLTQPASLDRDLAALVRDARRPRRTPRLIAAGAALTLALGGATTAVASGAWSPWAQSAPSNVFTVPSGIECELRMGNVIIGDPEAAAAAQDIIDHTDFIAEVDIEASLADYADSPASEDRIYLMALSSGAQNLVMDKLEERGFDLEAIYFGSISGEGRCDESIE